MRRFFSFGLIGLLLLGGCGYTTGSLLPSNFRNISIEQFKNKVGYLDDKVRGLYIPLLEIKAHDATVTRFQQDGHLKISDSEHADLILKGDLIGLDREDITLTDNENVEKYRIRITVSLVLINAVTGNEEWTESAFSGEGTYYTIGPNARSEDAALQDALTDLGRRIVERTIENW